MIAQGSGGHIVNTTSLSGMVGNFGQSNYSAAKAGIYGLTRTASIELQKHRITVNAIAPIAKTRMTEDLPMMQNADTLTPEHIAPGALFLASDRVGDEHIPGVIDGPAGLCAMRAGGIKRMVQEQTRHQRCRNMDMFHSCPLMSAMLARSFWNSF